MMKTNAGLVSNELNGIDPVLVLASSEGPDISLDETPAWQRREERRRESALALREGAREALRKQESHY